MEKAWCFFKHKRFSGVTAAQAPQPCANPSIPEHDAGTREGPAPVRARAELSALWERGRQDPSAPRSRGTSRAGGAEPAAARGEGAPAGTEGGSRGVGRRRGQAAAGRHGSPRCYKRAGRGGALHLSRPQPQRQEQHQRRGGTASDGHGDGAGGAARPGAPAPCPPPSHAGEPRCAGCLSPARLREGCGSGRAETLPPRRRGGFLPRGIPAGCAVPEPIAAPRGWPWVAGGSSARGGGGRDERAWAAPAADRAGMGADGRRGEPQPRDGGAGAVDYPGQNIRDEVGVRCLFSPRGILEGKPRTRGVSGS